MARYRRPGAHAPRPNARLFVALGALLVLAAAIAILVLALRGNPGGDPAAATTPTAPPTEAPTEAPSAEPSPEPSAEPTPEPTPEAVQAVAGARAYLVVKPTAIAEGYLPIIVKAETEEKIIAVTVDDFFQFRNAREIIDLALEYGGKLTLFPIGRNVLRDELHDTLVYAYENGMEIENHTIEHRPLYAMTDKSMARQIYLQSLAVNYVLGVDYQQHFFRPVGGDGRDDQRTHLYAEQLGMYAIAHWTVSGSDTGINRLLDSLAPGNIYLFHTTDSDTKKLRKFIPAAVEAGYTLVTLNEMFNLPANEVRPLPEHVDISDIPQISPYTLTPRTYKRDDYQWMAYLIQQRLVELGYLDGKPDGIYGQSTFMAVGYFQQANALPATGNADPVTQEALFSENAKKKK